MQDAAGVAEAVDAAPVHQMRVNSRHLGRDIRPHPHGASRQLINQLEGFQIQVMSGSGEQRLHIFKQWRLHQLVTVAFEKVEHGAAQRLDPARRRRQDILNILGQEPITHRKSIHWRKRLKAYT